MKFLKIDLLTMLISLFIFSSCEKNSTIGLEIDPSGVVQGALVDTLTIKTNTIRDDDGATYALRSGLTRYALGYLKDPIIGTTESALAMSVNLPNDAYDFGTNPLLDSAVLVLNYAGEFYGDSTANYTFDVQQLKNNLSKEDTYLSSKDFDNESQVLGSYNAKLFPNTPLKVLDVIAGATDTIATVKPQIRIKLNNSFINNNIIALPPSTMKYNASFQNSFKGLKLQVNTTNKATLQKGAIMFFNATSAANTGLYLYYRKTNDTDPTRTDTLSVKFPIATEQNAVAASIKHTYTPAVQTQLNDPSTQYAVTYLQPLAGLRNKVAIPYLKNLKNNLGKIIINKAELVIDLSSGTDIDPFKPAPRLSLYRYDIAGLRKNLPDNNDGYSTPGDPRANSSAFGGYFDSINKRYVFVITSYIQDLLDGKTQDYGTFLSITPTSTFDYTNTFNSASRAVIGSYKKNPIAGDNLIKLNLYYTKITP